MLSRVFRDEITPTRSDRVTKLGILLEENLKQKLRVRMMQLHCKARFLLLAFLFVVFIKVVSFCVYGGRAVVAAF